MISYVIRHQGLPELHLLQLSVYCCSITALLVSSCSQNQLRFEVAANSMCEWPASQLASCRKLTGIGDPIGTIDLSV